MRVLLVVHNFPPYWFGGVENYTYQYAKALKAAGCDVTVLHPLTDKSVISPFLREAEYDGLRVLRLVLDYMDNYVSQISNRETENVFSALLDREHFDIIHFHHTLKLSFSFLAVAKYHGCPVCLTLHDFWFLCPEIHLINQSSKTICAEPNPVESCCKCISSKPKANKIAQIEKWLRYRQEYAREAIRFVDTVSSPSSYLAKIFLKYKMVNDEITVRPLGIKTVSRVDKAGDNNSVTFGFLGTIRELKNAFFLAEVFKDVRGDAKLFFFGNGKKPDIKRLRTIIADDYRMEYRGGYEPRELSEIFAKIDVTIIPSRIENYPLVPRESLSAGVPVIASRVGGLPEIVQHLENGILFDPNNRHELISWMQQIVDNPQLLKRLAGGITKVMTIEEDAASWLENYRLLLLNGKGSLDQEKTMIQDFLKNSELELSKFYRRSRINKYFRIFKRTLKGMLK